MKYLLDTCFLSEIRKQQPNQAVIHWLTKVDEQNLYISAVSVCEIQKGISKLNDVVFQQKLTQWLDESLLPWFDNRIIGIDPTLARHWGDLLGQFERQGLPRPLMDSLIAVTAQHHDLVLVTRNIVDFEMFEVKLHNPWN